jgi:hypothetical protein
VKTSEDLLGDLNPVQREAVLATEGPVLIVAGAGSGKTRVITYRVAHLLRSGVGPRNILAITFTNKAADEMRARIRMLVGSAVAEDMWIMTFHSSCARLLRFEAEQLGFGRNFTIYDDQDAERVISGILKDIDLDPRRWTPRSFKNAISSAKNVCVDAAELDRVAQSYPERMAAQVYGMYEQARLRRPPHEDGSTPRDEARGAHEVAGAFPLHSHRRVPGHEPRSVPVREPSGRQVPEPVRRRGRGPVGVRVPGRRRSWTPRMRSSATTPSAKTRSSSPTSARGRRPSATKRTTSTTKRISSRARSRV